MSAIRLIFLTTIAMTAFAGNSLLCRIALKHTDIDAAGFTAIRLISGAVVLWLLVSIRSTGLSTGKGSWMSALALFIYAAGFSYAYISLPAGSGALLLFGAVQVTMIGYGLWCGERLRKPQLAGFLLAFAGIVGLVSPGVSAPPIGGSILMMMAGIAWGVYSLRGKGAGDPTLVTAGNFIRSVPIVLVLVVLMSGSLNFDYTGVLYAIGSGAVASGMGYAVWYSVLPALAASSAAIVQLSVPVIAAVGGLLFLSEPLTLRFVVASIATLGGIALVILANQKGVTGATKTR